MWNLTTRVSQIAYTFVQHYKAAVAYCTALVCSCSTLERSYAHEKTTVIQFSGTLYSASRVLQKLDKVSRKTSTNQFLITPTNQHDKTHNPVKHTVHRVTAKLNKLTNKDVRFYK